MKYIELTEREIELIDKIRRLKKVEKEITWQKGIELLCERKPVIIEHYNRMFDRWDGYEYRTDSNGSFVFFNPKTQTLNYNQQLDADDILQGKWYEK